MLSCRLVGIFHLLTMPSKAPRTKHTKVIFLARVLVALVTIPTTRLLLTRKSAVFPLSCNLLCEVTSLLYNVNWKGMG